MLAIPIIAHHDPHPDPDRIRLVESFGETLLDENPALRLPSLLRPLVSKHLEPGPTLHIDDLSNIPLRNRFHDTTYIEQRARLRATDGDFVACVIPPPESYEALCRERFGLGEAKWLHPKPRQHLESTAIACCTDRAVRHELVSAIRSGSLRWIHPHMGIAAVWNSALVLQRASRRRLSVIAPPPALTHAVNDKLWFAMVVKRLLGEHRIPPTTAVGSTAALAHSVQQLARSAHTIVVKLPDSAGGGGNLVFEGSTFLGLHVKDIRALLRERLGPLHWAGRQRLLVGAWEQHVACAPSIQLWIPPESDGLPIVEGLFEQTFEGENGQFAGNLPLRLEPSQERAILDDGWLLGRLFQRLGYVGRCSFDLLLIGDDRKTARHEFLECNGRWGGTSMPMLLMNRVQGDWSNRPYLFQSLIMPGLDRIPFAQLVQALDDLLYDHRSGHGKLLLINPGALVGCSGFDVVVRGRTIEEAKHVLNVTLPRRLRTLIEQSPAREARGSAVFKEGA